MKKITAILFGLLLVNAIFIASAIATDDLNAKKLVTVYIENQDDVDSLSDLGLDIWEVDQGQVIARVYDWQILDLKGKCYRVELLREKFFALGAVPISSQTAYHSYSSLKTALKTLVDHYPNISRVYDIGDSWEKTVGIADRDLWAIKISDNVTNEEDDEPDILFMGGLHAREWISVEVPFYLAMYLLDLYGTDQKVKQLVDSREIWIVPLVNPDGLEYSRTYDRNWRKNRRDNGDGTFGVDPNRNFGYNWGRAGSSGDPKSIIYRGVAPFSEPETQAIRDFVATHEFYASISYHSYSQLVLYPWGYTRDAAPHKAQLSKMAEDMANAIRDVHGMNYTPKQASDLYRASGDSDDWLYGVYNIAAFTVELRPKTLYDLGGKPFELPADQIIPTCEENLPAALYLIAQSPQFDVISPANESFVDHPVTVSVENPLEVVANFNATVNIDNVSDLTMVMFNLSYDPSVIRLKNVDHGSDIASSWSLWRQDTSTAGTVNVFAFASFSGSTIDGSAELARLEFTVVGEVGDRSDIDIQGLLGDSDMGYIESIWRASEVCIGVKKKLRELSPRRSQSLRQERSNPRLGFLMPLRSPRTLR
ncbi:Murein tripeptide amidase MpaA [Methanophagales archaeon]|nr:Murein tripeptide amidase MpaA [Methanophagales archaeon]